MATLNFNEYKINKMEYIRNPNFNESKVIFLNPKFKLNTDINNNIINVTIDAQIGDSTNDNVPFKITCSITGNFIYSSDEDNEKLGIKSLVESNAVAILYPYLRSTISSLTNLANEFPTYIMPTINVNEILKSQDNND